MKNLKERMIQKMTININANESVVDLERNGYNIIQSRDCFCFGMDAVLLSSWAHANQGETVVDLGTGNGIIPILMEAKTEAKRLVGIEIQPQSVDMARRSVEMNKQQSKIEILEGDIKDASQILGKNAAEVVVTNPPYMKENSGISNPEDSKAIARHEIKCNLEDVIKSASELLKPKGRFYMINRPRRLTETFTLMHQYGIEPKTLKMIHPYINKDANMFLIEGVRGSKSMIKVEEPLIVYKEENVYTEELLKMYGKE